ncbi:SgcJ/EcaC family oxidoreductase [Aquisphaera insulae]|uniref:SgcJ/EcaC family oxidoreductase n=1 Tax=Aquisphaera insulae TaxID=2712864 RepID=UPI0013E9AA14|nr:SgcJ/EcaC family oxidoreductase [Aquisphaera insulae]
MNRAYFLIGAGLLGLLATIAPARSRAVQEPAPRVQAPTPAAVAEDHVADRALLRDLVAAFTKAFNEGDARSIAGLFTPGARVTTLGGEVIDGRDSIEKRFAASFEQSPGQKIQIQTQSVRFLDADSAIEEGTSTITAADGSGELDTTAETTRYSVAYVKREGRWLQETLRDELMPEVATEETAASHLKELEWLIGEWVDESDEAEVRTSGSWAENRAFLVRVFHVKVNGKEAMSGSQRIGWDPKQKQFRSWVFDSDGGFSEGLWSRDGDRWLIKSSGTLKDGRTVSATNIVSRNGKDSMTWFSTDRTLGGEIMPDEDAVTLVRIPPKPGLAKPAAAGEK